MSVRYAFGVLCLTLSSYALATNDDKGKEEMDFTPTTAVPIQDIVVHEHPVVTKRPEMEEVTVNPSAVTSEALEEDIESAHLFLELSNSPDPEVKEEYRKHLKDSRGRLDLHRKALRSSLKSSGGSPDQNTVRLESKVSAALTKIDEMLTTQEIPTHVHGIPIERFRQLHETSHKQRMEQLAQELKFYEELEKSPVIVVSKNPCLAKDLVILKRFDEQLRHLEIKRQYFGETRSIYQLMCPNEQEEIRIALIMKQIIDKVRKHKRVQPPDCFMENYTHDQCKALLKRIVELFNLPIDHEPFAQQTREYTVLMQTAPDSTPVAMRTTRTPEQLAQFQERVTRSKELARALKYEQMDDEFRAIYLADLEGVFNEMLADPWYLKNKEQADMVQANPSLFSQSHIEASKNILGYESVMRAVIAETKERLGRK